MYPLNQRDATAFGCTTDDLLVYPVSESKTNEVTLFDSPSIDFTPSEYISLLFTDLGVLTPAAVSDALIKLYQ